MVEEGGGGGKKESARNLALSVLDMARDGVPPEDDLRAGMRVLDASEKTSVTYLLAS